jgi:hypothetical protein
LESGDQSPHSKKNSRPLAAERRDWILSAPAIIFLITLHQGIRKETMCRNIKTLHNFKPPATEEEIRASAIQFVRKLSGFNKPSKTNESAFNHAVDEVTRVATELLDSLVTNAPPRDREVVAAKARERTALRFHSTEAR